MNTKPTRGRPSLPLIIALAGLAVLLAVATPFVLVGAGIVGYGEHATSVNQEDRADVEQFEQSDPHGAKACRYLDMEMSGIGTWADVAEYTVSATTMTIRTATTERELYDACTAAGARLQPWPGKLPSFD